MLDILLSRVLCCHALRVISVTPQLGILEYKQFSHCELIARLNHGLRIFTDQIVKRYLYHQTEL